MLEFKVRLQALPQRLQEVLNDWDPEINQAAVLNAIRSSLGEDPNMNNIPLRLLRWGCQLEEAFEMAGPFKVPMPGEFKNWLSKSTLRKPTPPPVS